MASLCKCAWFLCVYSLTVVTSSCASSKHLQTRRFLDTIHGFLLDVQRMLIQLHRAANERPAPFVDHAGVLRDSKTGHPINGRVIEVTEDDEPMGKPSLILSLSSVAEDVAIQWAIPSSTVPKSSWPVGGSGISPSTSGKSSHWPSTDWNDEVSQLRYHSYIVHAVSVCESITPIIYVVNVLWAIQTQ